MLDENACNVLNTKIDGIKDDIYNLNKRIDNLENKFVSVDRFRPVEMIAYAIISLFGGGLVMAILALIIKR